MNLTSLSTDESDKHETMCDLTKKLQRSEAEVLRLNERLQQMQSSQSWRITHPLRKVHALVRFVVRKGGRAIYVARREGLSGICRIVKNRYLNRVTSKFRKIRHARDLQTILKAHEGKPIIVFKPHIDWNVPLFQRPQHLAKELAQQGFLYLYCSSSAGFDDIVGFQEVGEGCYVTDRYDLVCAIPGKKIIHIYAHDLSCYWPFIDRHLRDGNTVVYEYVDEIHDQLTGLPISDEIYDRHKTVSKCEDIICIATADKLYNEIMRVRSKNAYLVTNGVELDHFMINQNMVDAPDELRSVVEKKKPIIGYYGALASWVDYDLVLKLADQRPEYEIVLIGWDYDYSMANYNLNDMPNITIFGPIDYKILPKYACWFDVSTIPFRINEITESTSPIKLFEYMALGHPIVTTDLPECRKYKSVLIGRSDEEYISMMHKALGLIGNAGYQAILREEAQKNSWQGKAQVIADAIRSALQESDSK